MCADGVGLDLMYPSMHMSSPTHPPVPCISVFAKPTEGSGLSLLF